MRSNYNKAPDMTPESNNLDYFLESTEIIDWRSPEILAAARSIAGSHDSDVEASRRLFEWVRDSTHPFFVGTLFVPQMRSLPRARHPLVNAFLRAAMA